MSQQDDINQLNLLGIFHYVLGGLTGLFSYGTLGNILVGIGMITGRMGKVDAPPAFIGWFFLIMGLMLFILAWCLAICLFISGRKLRQCKGRVFSLVVAGIECAFVPFGTILGIFTLIALNKESVKELYKQ